MDPVVQHAPDANVADECENPKDEVEPVHPSEGFGSSRISAERNASGESLVFFVLPSSLLGAPIFDRCTSKRLDWLSLAAVWRSFIAASRRNRPSGARVATMNHGGDSIEKYGSIFISANCDRRRASDADFNVCPDV